MNTWIVTTGNRDIQLNTNDNWESLYEQVRYQPTLKSCSDFLSPPDRDKETGLFPAPARVLGLVYGNQLNHYEDLEFPLLNTFLNYFKENSKERPNKVVVLLTDQKDVFNEDRIINEQCPYWQDTCTLEPLFEKYFEENFKTKPLFLHLCPTSGQGLDHWNDTLQLVENTFRSVEDLNSQSSRIVYVSHQAGTPAISSAVQFASLGKFKEVNFLVSNRYFNDDYENTSEAEKIPSSNYWRGIQIQKAKSLILKGSPGAARELLREVEGIRQNAIFDLDKLVDFFNLSSSGADSNKDFEVPQATQRIVDTLDLVAIFLQQRNFLQGITLLSAAQETFLKVAIWSKVETINKTITLGNHQLVEWNDRGLILNKIINEVNPEIKKHTLDQLSFPKRYEFKANKNDNFIISNSWMFTWLRSLEPNFKSWELLKWSYMDKDRYDEHKHDLRNQIMHNLRGVEEKDVIKYLLGNKESHVTDIMEVYNENIKMPFFNALQLLKLPFKRELSKKLREIADSLT